MTASTDRVARRGPEPITNPRVIRAVLRYREAVAQATKAAFVELRAAGVADPAAVFLGRWPGATIP